MTCTMLFQNNFDRLEMYIWSHPKKRKKKKENIYLLGSEWELLDCIAARASTALLTALMASKADVNGLLEDVVVVGKLGGSVRKILVINSILKLHQSRNKK